MSNASPESKHPASPRKDDHDVIYTLRTAHQNQTQLVIMADKKAHILIGVISVILTILFTKFNLETDLRASFILPFAVFLLLEIIAVVLALLVIIPSTKRFKTPADIDNIPNPLFFGFFTNYPQEEYVDFLLKRVDDNDAARRALVTDLYQIGCILKKKYRLLRYSYLSATAGILIPLIAVLASLF